MKRQPRVGIVIDLDDTWLGGLNYYRTLVTAVYEDPSRSIDIVVLTGKRAKPAQLAGFPDVEVVRTAMLDHSDDFWSRWRWRMQKYMRRDFLLRYLLRRHRIDILSHFGGFLGRSRRVKVAAWIPDFQHVHLADKFTRPELADRGRRFLALTRDSDVVLLSSGAALEDLTTLYPAAVGRAAVLRFVPWMDLGADLPSRAMTQAKYRFEGPFFYLPNQYWAHKNHRVVIEAIALLRDQGCEVRVISTGAPRDYRDPTHYKTLCQRIDALAVGTQYLRLGVIPYQDLLALMRDSVCVINPSRFEGWSTSVEEAKAMSKRILLSDIPVHREQSPAGATFFPVDDAAALAHAMRFEWQRALEGPVRWEGLSADYAQRRRAFARDYQAIMARTLAGGRRAVAA